MCETAASDPGETGSGGSGGSQMSRCVVRMRRPDLRQTEKLIGGESSHLRSTLERQKHSIHMEVATNTQLNRG
ncbi:hypothetical protein SAY86_024598 [Trapa natans]|uniref:Uncharacterized protein n=1 Tax=Trapa natans TaxID=22666 RepID=A0AAN7RJV3_TRANT|nr:hypothetical protein SAY86_024598 [Trapa natans]